MPDIMMPLPPDALYWRTKLFELRDPITLLPEKFNEVWPLVILCTQKSKANMSVGFGRARYRAQHDPIPTIRPLSDNTVNMEEDTQCTGRSVDRSYAGNIEQFNRRATRGYCDKKQAM